MPGQAPPHADETELLLAFITQQRDGIKNAAFGLTDEQARLTPTAGALSVGGLVVHVTAMEQSWVDMILQRDGAGGAGDGGAEDDYEAGFRLAPDRTLAEAIAAFDAVAAETEAVVRGLPLDHPVPVPQGVPWFPDDVEAWSVRWVLLHLIEEIGRHAGHADIVRESIDGATMYELMAGAEGWPATDWMQPWTVGDTSADDTSSQNVASGVTS
ncbi:MAG: DinB family protein [Ilumatobacteraceae bacterium]